MKKPIIVSGIQASGNMHIGNYLGALKNFVALQNSGDYEMYIFIADWHALSGNIPKEKLNDQIDIAYAEFMACGIDPQKITFFVQSHVKEHAELSWILHCVTPVAELYRMTQYKDKSEDLQKATAGLLTYPILQAADILIYHGTLVPVGIDQVQHVELTRDCARWFNNKYGEYFAEAKPLLTENAKVMSLLMPEKKMSKSLGEGHCINMADEPEVIEQKIKKAVTATEGGENSPGAANLIGLLKDFSDNATYEFFLNAEKDGTIRYGDLKRDLSKAIAEYFANFRAKRAELLADREYLHSLMREGADKARPKAAATVADVRRLVGLDKQI